LASPEKETLEQRMSKLAEQLLKQEERRMENAGLANKVVGRGTNAPLDQDNISITLEYMEAWLSIQVKIAAELATHADFNLVKGDGPIWQAIYRSTPKGSAEWSYIWRELIFGRFTIEEWNANDHASAVAKEAHIANIRYERGERDERLEGTTSQMEESLENMTPLSREDGGANWQDNLAPDVTDPVHEDYEQLSRERLSEVGQSVVQELAYPVEEYVTPMPESRRPMVTIIKKRAAS